MNRGMRGEEIAVLIKNEISPIFNRDTRESINYEIPFRNKPSLSNKGTVHER